MAGAIGWIKDELLSRHRAHHDDNHGYKLHDDRDNGDVPTQRGDYTDGRPEPLLRRTTENLRIRLP